MDIVLPCRHLSVSLIQICNQTAGQSVIIQPQLKDSQISMLCVGNLTKIPTCEKQKIEKTHAKENNHTHKTIFMWFGNLRTSTELQGFHYYQGRRKYKMRLQYFLLSPSRMWQQQPTILKNANHGKVDLYI